jgi:hypothetical protein
MTVTTFTTYQAPGVYVTNTTVPVITSTGVPQQVLAICGPALGFRSAVQSFLISSTVPTQLTFGGVFTTAVTGPPAIGAPVVTNVAGTILTSGVDYSLTVTPDPSGNSALAITSVLRVNTSPNVTEGQQVTVRYNYADITYYQPQVFTDYQSVLNAYGSPFVSSIPTTPNATQVANPLSYAAQVAFANQANTIYTVALNPADGNLEAQFISAYAKLANLVSATIVVPVFSDDLTPPSGTVAAFAGNLANDLALACTNASNAGYPRIGFFGLPRNYSENDEPIPNLCALLSSRRLVLAYPEIVIGFNSITNAIFNASGCYLAVALGAILSTLPISTGLTQQTLSGFGGLTQLEITNMTQSFMNSLASSGACIVFRRWDGVLVVRQGLTTDMDTLNDREISMVRQGDILALLVTQGFTSSGLIGSPIATTSVATVQAALTSILEQAITQGVISDYTNVTVVQQAPPSGDPTILSCTFEYMPFIPMNYIQVQYSLNLNTGTVTTQSAQNALSP